MVVLAAEGKTGFGSLTEEVILTGGVLVTPQCWNYTHVNFETCAAGSFGCRG